MSNRYCFLCASDDGVFLDITTDNRDTFVDQLEICLSKKVNESIKLSNQICYKCAYELDQCTKFVQKYKKSHKSSKPETETSMPCCSLCFEHVESNRIFDISKDNRAIFNPLQKIRKIFNEDLTENNSKLICLTCRYNLDVLYDLRRVYEEAVINLKALINEEIDYTNFPKVYTDVVNRKTTITKYPDITVCGLINSDSENSENMARNKPRPKSRKGIRKARNKSRNNIKPKTRKCDECHNIVPNGTDMYRFHRTRLTVCRNCWITMDPSKDKIKRRSRQVESNLAETKLCAVFLTDVLDKQSHKDEKEIEKNRDNTSHIISEDSSLENSSEDRLSENYSNLVSKSGNNAVNNNTKQKKKRQISAEMDENVESTPIKVTKLNKKRESANAANVSFDVEQQSTTDLRRGRKRTTVSDQSSDSDVPPLRSRETLNDHAKLLSSFSSKPDRKKLKTILEGVTVNIHSESTDESSIDDTNVKKTKNSSNTHTNKEKNTRKRTRSSSISSVEMTSLGEFKSPKSTASSEIKKTCHNCDICGKKFDTKLASVEHSLTHFMQVSLKLERVTISSIKEKQELKIDSREGKIFKTKACSIKTVSIDKHTDDSSEDISINVVDTDDELSSLSREQSAKKKEMEKDSNNEECKMTDTLDADNELCVEKMKIQSDEEITEESEQCVESTAMLNETVTSIKQDKDTKESNVKNKNIQEKDVKNKNASLSNDINTLKDKDTNVQKDVVKNTSSTSKFLCELNTNINVEKNKDLFAENDIKVSNSKKEKSNNEINNDEEHFHDETMHDSIVTESSDLLIDDTTKDIINPSENCKSDLKDSYKENESEIIKDVEMRQCDLTNTSQEENINDSKEKDKTVLNIIEHTEALKDQVDLNDTEVVDDYKIEASEKQQDSANEQSKETEVIIDIDETNNAKDELELDLLNGEKLYQAEDDKEESDNTIISANSNNGIEEYAKVTEETIAVDSSKEEDKLEETIKNLEELINSDTMNNKCEEQGNSSHTSNDSPMDAANMILKEVFDLAAAEVQKREDVNNPKSLQDTEIETLENITREIRNSADMPSLDPINIVDIDDNDITLN